MNTSELYDAFRLDVVDTARPYLWTDDEVFRYMADAHRMFHRLIGGIADFTSEACVVECPAGEQNVTLHPSILRIMTATRVSDRTPVKVINQTDIPVVTSVDYGQRRELFMDNRPGPIKSLVIGMQRGIGRVIQVPEVADQLALSVYRVPLAIVSGPEQELTETDEEHHIHLLNWMEHLAYLKQDAETFDRAKSEEKETKFRDYCKQVVAEWERYKHKTRVVQYGGI